ncbi:WXG100 family type VII secretion target [Aldersonia kunmingensis]|uniref:WXG100 family type VII secretion target n=1 Tax=Aldersonia kunmingensis TaxID=408066 RepID=UPI000833436F|nr:WXG100 family type VII secretion target [Aldersonia kunmingensis]
MKYNFAEMLALASDIHSNAGKLIETHDELKSYVSNLASSWEDGKAREGYLQVQAQWDSAHDDIIQVLNTIAKVVENGTVDMQSTEDKNALSWA